MNEALVVCNIVAVVIALLALFRPQPALHKRVNDLETFLAGLAPVEKAIATA